MKHKIAATRPNVVRRKAGPLCGHFFSAVTRKALARDGRKVESVRLAEYNKRTGEMLPEYMQCKIREI
jgi:hypothetical protein